MNVLDNYLASTALDNTIVVTSFTKSAPASIELEGCVSLLRL